MTAIGTPRIRAPKRGPEWVSGFCNPSNDEASHGRCKLQYAGHPCACGCHTITEDTMTTHTSDPGAPTNHPDSAGEAIGSLDNSVPGSGQINLRVLPDLEQGSEEWHDQRRGMVTASVVGQLITAKTVKPADNDTSRGLIATLTAERITGYTEPSFMNDDMMRGVMHEPIARDRYAEHNGVTVTEVGFMVRDDWGFEIGYSPDGLVGDDGLLEIKCPRAKTHLRTVVAGEIPAHYMAQCQTGLLVSGRKWIDFVSFCAGQPMWTKRVTPDERWFAAIVEAVAAFEKASEQMASDYLGAVAGLPVTERVAELEMSL